MFRDPFESTTALGIVRPWDEFSGADFLKSDNSGNWTQANAPADPGPYLPINYRHVLQRFHDKHVEIIADDPLPDPKELNKQIPIAEWQPGYNSGPPRPPWGHALQLVLMNLRTGAQVIYSASNTRCTAAVVRLMDQIRSKNFLFGRTASPVVGFASAPFPTQYGMQRRGDFQVLDRPWVDLNGGPTLPGPTAPKQLPEPSLAAELNDTIPDFGPEEDMPFELGENDVKSAAASHVAKAPRAARR